MNVLKPLRLGQTVSVRGSDFLGRDGCICFRPAPNPRDLSWEWVTKKKAARVRVGPGIVDVSSRRIQLKHDDEHLNVWEHVGILKYFGLMSVSVSSTEWPPYHGRSLELWHAVKDHCWEDGRSEIPLYTVKRPVRFEYPSLRGGHKAFTEIWPTNDACVDMEVSASFSGLGTGGKSFSTNSTKSLEDMCSARALGWPSWLYHPSKVADWLHLWPHHRTVAWKQNCRNPSVLFSETLTHRAQDILGALSLLCGDGLFVGRIISVCSGHEADIQAILKAAAMLKRI